MPGVPIACAGRKGSHREGGHERGGAKQLLGDGWVGSEMCEQMKRTLLDVWTHPMWEVT